jgi:hypothetical protein
MAAHVANVDERGCALANAAVEMPDKDHPARAVIEEFKRRQRSELVRLCRTVYRSRTYSPTSFICCRKARGSPLRV